MMKSNGQQRGQNRQYLGRTSNQNSNIGLVRYSRLETGYIEVVYAFSDMLGIFPLKRLITPPHQVS